MPRCPAVVLALACSTAFLFISGLAPQPPAQPPTGAPPADRSAAQPPDIGAMLIKGLRATPGCLGTESARTISGKAVIFAWFENKKAALAWYKSDAHQQAMDLFQLDADPKHIPLEGIPDDSGPIMVVASLKFSATPLPGTHAPVSEIAIELYSPLRGGIRVNSGFAPASLKVPGRQDITLEPPKPAAPSTPGSEPRP